MSHFRPSILYIPLVQAVYYHHYYYCCCRLFILLSSFAYTYKPLTRVPEPVYGHSGQLQTHNVLLAYYHPPCNKPFTRGENIYLYTLEI